MMREKRTYLGLLLLVFLMTVTGCVLLKNNPINLLWDHLKQLKPAFLALGLALMFCYVGCEALCTWQILRHLGHKAPYSHCLGYSFAGFYVSSITPSSTGGQPAQIYYMNRDGIPVAHGALNMMLIAVCYQIASVIWGGAAWLFLPSAREKLDGGLELLLLYGAGMMLLLTLGMAGFMFLPGPSRRVSQAALRLLKAMHILRDSENAQKKLEHLLAEYNGGAACVKRNPGLALSVLVLCLLQQGLLYTVPWIVYLAFGLNHSTWFEMAGLQALLTLAVCNLPLPGAVGPAEGGFVAAFATVFGAELVTPAMLVSRGISFYAFLIISCAITIIVHLRSARKMRERALQEITVGQTTNRVEAVRKFLEEESRKERKSSCIPIPRHE